MNTVNYVLHHRTVYFKMSEDERLSPYHLSVYNALFMLWNECGFATKLSINRNDVMKLSKIGNQNTYTKVLKELHEYGYIIYEPSFNPLKGSLVTIIRCDKGGDKGSVKGGSKGADKGDDTLYKQLNFETEETIETIDYKFYFDCFWSAYDKKRDSKKCFEKFKKIDSTLYDFIIDKAQQYANSTPDIKYRKNPLTWLNGNCWEDEIVTDLNNNKNERFNAATAELRKQFRGL